MTQLIEKIIEDLKKLTLIETSELITKIETTFNIDPLSNITPTNTVSLNQNLKDNSNIEEKTEFTLMLDEVPSTKIPVLKVVRSLTGLGLKDAKDLVESAPKQIKEKMKKEDAEEAKAQIEAAGGKASLI